MPNTFEILLVALDFAFNFWFFLLLAPIQRRRNALPRMLLGWIMLAVVRVILIFNPQPMPRLCIPEPANTIVFVATGVGLFAWWLLLKRRQREQFTRKMGDVSTLDDLLQLSPTEFENMVVELYHLAGHEANRTGKTGDQGVDVVVHARNGEKWIVQCKRWRGSVGQSIIRDFYGAMQHEKADKGTLITTGKFTRQALEWAKGKPISLYDGDKLLQVWKKANKRRTLAAPRAR